MPKAVIELTLAELETLFGLKSGESRNSIDLGDSALVKIRDGVLKTFFEKHFESFLAKSANKEVESRARAVIKQYVDAKIGFYKKDSPYSTDRLIVNPVIAELLQAAIDKEIKEVFEAELKLISEDLRRRMQAHVKAEAEKIGQRIDKEVAITIDREVNAKIKTKALDAVQTALKSLQ